ncbi:YgcG family protein [Peptoniphilus sp. oral taxon 386]|uniref:TPM domain-containing protein n=1 Tax=Peptoniphilus sp. oral taxon 386 TaxID=652713 RepID=UPI00030910F0|nr:TPM domain-containing protein [Peptoniphilus sp. oral taxon 386]
MKNIRRFIFLTVCLLLFSTNVFAAASLDKILVSPSAARGCVYDEVNILSDENIEYINNTNSDLQNKTKGQIAVVIINSLENYDIEQYATKLFEKWKIGDEKQDNGVLILFAIDDRKMRIETGYGAEGFIPDAYASRTIRNMAEIFKRNSDESDKSKMYQDGIMEGYNEILSHYAKEYGVEIENIKQPMYGEYLEYSEYKNEDELTFSEDMIIFVIIILIVITSNMIKPRKKGKRRRYHGHDFFGGGSFRGSSGGGSFGGGFSGRGGSSGGGGASGGW